MYRSEYNYFEDLSFMIVALLVVSFFAALSLRRFYIHWKNANAADTRPPKRKKKSNGKLQEEEKQGFLDLAASRFYLFILPIIAVFMLMDISDLAMDYKHYKNQTYAMESGYVSDVRLMPSEEDETKLMKRVTIQMMTDELMDTDEEGRLEIEVDPSRNPEQGKLCKVYYLPKSKDLTWIIIDEL